MCGRAFTTREVWIKYIKLQEYILNGISKSKRVLQLLESSAILLLSSLAILLKINLNLHAENK